MRSGILHVGFRNLSDLRITVRMDNSQDWMELFYLAEIGSQTI